jgi:hypothetical protein
MMSGSPILCLHARMASSMVWAMPLGGHREADRSIAA